MSGKKPPNFPSLSQLSASKNSSPAQGGARPPSPPRPPSPVYRPPSSPKGGQPPAPPPSSRPSPVQPTGALSPKSVVPPSPFASVVAAAAPQNLAKAKAMAPPPPVANAPKQPAQGWGSIKQNVALISSHAGSIGVGAAPNKPHEVHRTAGPPTPPMVVATPPSSVPGTYIQLVIVRDHDGTEFRLKDIDLAVDTVGRVKALLARAMRCLQDHVVFLPSAADNDTLAVAGVKANNNTHLSVRQEGRPLMYTPLAPERNAVTPLPTYYPPTTEHLELEAFRQQQLDVIKAEAHAEVRRAKEVQIQTAMELDTVRREYQSLTRALECVPFMHESPYARSVDTRLVADNARAEAVREELQRSTMEFEAKKITLDRRATELKREAEALENQKRQIHLEDVRRHSALRSPGRGQEMMPSMDVVYDAALDVSRQWHQSETAKERELQREIDVLQESLERRRRSRSPPKYNESPVRTQQQLYPLPSPASGTERRGLRTPNSF